MFSRTLNTLVTISEEVVKYIKYLAKTNKQTPILVALLCFALSKSLTVLSLWIVHPGSAIWTMQLECTLFCEPLVVETCKKEGLTH